MKYNKICTPASLYLIISIVSILVALFYGLSLAIVLGKVVFVLFWIFLLNLLCKSGYTSISWFLVLLPYVVIMAVFIIDAFVLNKTQNYSFNELIQQAKMNGTIGLVSKDLVNCRIVLAETQKNIRDGKFTQTKNNVGSNLEGFRLEGFDAEADLLQKAKKAQASLR